MKLSLKHHNQIVVIETDDEDSTLEEMCQFFRQLLLGAGYLFNGEVIIDEPDKGDNIQGD